MRSARLYFSSDRSIGEFGLFNGNPTRIRLDVYPRLQNGPHTFFYAVRNAVDSPIRELALEKLLGNKSLRRTIECVSKLC